MALVIKMDEFDKDEFIIRCRQEGTTASAVVRNLITKWKLEHPVSQKTRQKPAVE
jgi:hypothetical protein